MAVRNLLDASASAFADAVQRALQQIIGQNAKTAVVESMKVQRHTDFTSYDDIIEIRLLVRGVDNPFKDPRSAPPPSISLDPETDLISAHFIEEWARREKVEKDAQEARQAREIEEREKRLQEIRDSMHQKQMEAVEKMLTNGLQDLLMEPFKLTLAPSDGQSDKIRVNKPRSITGAWVDEAEKLPDPPPAPTHERWLK